MSTPSAAISQSVTAGLVVVDVESDDAAAFDRVVWLLGQYDVPWSLSPAPSRLTIRVSSELEPGAAGAPRGDYLRCMRFSVDRDGADYRGETRTRLRFRYNDEASALHIVLPPPTSGAVGRDTLEELEQVVTFALTCCWRRSGWTPLHAGTLCTRVGGACALLCTHSGGGKSTLVASLLRRGFKTLGDDKVLVRAEAGGPPTAAALARDTNLHPRSARWFPEVGDLEAMPLYSHWTEKRKLGIQQAWPGCLLPAAAPTHVLLLERTESAGPITVAPMSQAETLGALMRQVVIPSDRAQAREIVRVLTALTHACGGHAVTIPDHAYDRPNAAAPVEELLR